MTPDRQRYQIIIGSPVTHEELVAYIVINGEHIALLSQESGPDFLRIEFFDEPRVQSVDFDIFLEALGEAKRLLLG